MDCPVVSKDLILRVHDFELLEDVTADPLCSTAWHSAGGVVKAAEMVYEGSLRNAFCYIGAGGHHAGKRLFWGYCCFNDVVLAIENLRENKGEVRCAILDTDAHHGDGTRELVEGDENILHFCICMKDFESSDGLRIDRNYRGLDKKEYIEIIDEFSVRVDEFSPEMIFWYFGHDTHTGDYADAGLTVDEYMEISKKLKGLAKSVCDEKLVVVLGGGMLPNVAKASTLTVIKELLKP
ncbi:histone deacetylase [Geoglobus acetivorans]|uniref:Histone deacetylase n=1 Tax=Geoglobus acetivorans TaxID=565033 RepID=A0ABZ3H3Q8_GEOAI